MIRLMQRSLVAGLAVCLTLLAGCYSADRHTVESTAFSPKTVTVVDSLNREVLWRMEVPVGQSLVIDFGRDQGGEGFVPQKGPAKIMKYELRHTVKGGSVEKGQVEMSGEPALFITETGKAIRQSPGTGPSGTAPATTPQ